MLTNFNYHKLPQIKSRTYLECWVNFSKYPHLGRTHVESCRCQSTDTSDGASTNQRPSCCPWFWLETPKRGISSHLLLLFLLSPLVCVFLSLCSLVTLTPSVRGCELSFHGWHTLCRSTLRETHILHQFFKSKHICI